VRQAGYLSELYWTLYMKASSTHRPSHFPKRNLKEVLIEFRLHWKDICSVLLA